MAEKSPQDERHMIEVGERIRKARLPLGWTQKQLGDRTNDPHIARMLTLFENGGDHMRMLQFFKITKAVGLTPNDVAPSDMFAPGESIIDDFLEMSIEHQDMIRRLIKSLKDADKLEREKQGQ